MNEFLTPEGIYDQFSKGVIDKDEAVKRLISLFEKSDKSTIRAESLKVLARISIDKEEIFDFLESCLISDENWRVRSTAAEILIKYLPTKSEPPIKWAIDNDASYPCMFRIFRALKDADKRNLSELFNYMRDKYTKKYQTQFDLDWHEAMILGMLDLILTDSENAGETKPDFTLKVEQNHVVELNLEGIQFDEFEGLHMFPKLRSLEIMGEKLKVVKDLEHLENLTRLYIYDAKIENIKMFDMLTNLEELGLYNNNISNTSGIEKLSHLKRLDLGCNPITSIEGLDKLYDLTFLNIHFDAGSGTISGEKRKRFEEIKNRVLNNKARNIMMYLFLD